MTSTALGVATASVRGWTYLYTCGLPAPVALRRRAEIESDLWELQHDPDRCHGPTQAAHILLRLAAGLLDDVLWRVEQVSVDAQVLRTVRVITTAVFLLTVLWVVPLSSGK